MRPHSTLVACLVTLLMFTSRVGSAATTQKAPLGVSPLLVDAAADVWDLIARPGNPIWPDWDAHQTPLLLYLPGQQDLLINHPVPPEGFKPYTGPLRFPAATMLVKNGPTIVSFDGQNTAIDVNGVRTLVVADPLSNLRSQVQGLLEDPRAASDKVRTLEYRTLLTDPYDQLALVVHEAFHVHQHRIAPDRSANEMLLLAYPVLSVENNVGFGLEAAALADALEAKDDASFRAAARRWYAVRQHRRAALPQRAVQYEDGAEFGEGLAKYTEYRLFQVLEGRTPGAGLERAQGFTGYGDLSAYRNRLADRMRAHLRGEVSVNNAPYGTAPVRMRFYYSGMAIGLLLDRLSPDWKQELISSGRSLTELAGRALASSPGDLAAGWQAAIADTGYAPLLAIKQRLHDEGTKAALARLAAIENGTGTGVVVDFSRLSSHSLSLSFTPFGITAVDSVRTIFDQVPISAGFADGSELTQSMVMPLLQDKRAGRVSCRLAQTLDRASLERMVGLRLGSSAPRAYKLELPGLTLDLKRATLEWRAGTLVAVLQPDAK